jgi:hypothetical protein
MDGTVPGARLDRSVSTFDPLAALSSRADRTACARLPAARTLRITVPDCGDSRKSRLAEAGLAIARVRRGAEPFRAVFIKDFLPAERGATRRDGPG